MPRSYDPTYIIQLPLLDAPGWLALGRELVARIDAISALPGTMVPAAKRLRAAVAELAAALRERLAGTTEETPVTRAADRVEDAAWAALQLFLSAWSRIPGAEDKNALADGLLAVLFAGGLKFTKLDYRSEWSEAETRLATLRTDKHKKALVALGGAPFLAALEKAHEAYGKALGITAEKADTGGEPASIRAPLAALHEAVRSVALKAAAHADPDDPDATALSERLLEPLASARSRAAAIPATPAPIAETQPQNS